MYDSADNDDLIGDAPSDSPSSIPHGFASHAGLRSGGGPHSVDLNLQSGVSRLPQFRCSAPVQNSIGGERFSGDIGWNNQRQVVLIK